MEGDDLVAVESKLDTPFENIDQLVVHAGVLVKAIEGGQGIGLLVVDFEDPQVGVDGRRGVADLELVDPSQAEQRLLLDVRVVVALQDADIDVDHHVPAAHGTGQTLGLFDGLLPARIFAGGLAPPMEGAALIHEIALGQLGQALVHALPLVMIGELLELDLVDLV